MNGRPYVFDTTEYGAELARLRAIEEVFDAGTCRCLLSTGVGSGWRSLEVGAGAGSIAKWLSKTAGSNGHTLAVDVNARFLSTFDAPNLEVHEADIRAASIPAASFDLAHARFVLIHMPQWADGLAVMLAALKPGGWLVLEEPDFSMSRSLAGDSELRRSFDNVHRAIEAMFSLRAMDYAFGARLPAVLQERSLEDISIENDSAIVCGGSPHALMMGMSTSALADKYIATKRATAQDIERYVRFAADPACWATYHATIRAVARKPQLR
jgi:SAM-dependent methyltransferase